MIENAPNGISPCTGDTYSETRGPARLPAQVARLLGDGSYNNLKYTVEYGEEKNILYLADQSNPVSEIVCKNVPL
jgi:hypothetical protein